MISLLIYLIFIIYIYIKYKPSCISESYYLLKYPRLFTVWIFLVVGTVFPLWVETSPENYQFMTFLSVVCLLGVGIFPNYLQTDKRKHIIATIGAAALSIVWGLLFKSYITLIAFIIVGLLLIFFKKKQKLFWIENTAFLQIYTQILIS